MIRKLYVLICCMLCSRGEADSHADDLHGKELWDWVTFSKVTYSDGREYYTKGLDSYGFLEHHFGYCLNFGNLVSFGCTWKRYNTVYRASWLLSSDHKMIFNILSTEGRCNQPDKAVSRWIKHAYWQAIHQWNPNSAEFAVRIVANFMMEMLTQWELDWKKQVSCCRCWQGARSVSAGSGFVAAAYAAGSWERMRFK